MEVSTQNWIRICKGGYSFVKLVQLILHIVTIYYTITLMSAEPEDDRDAITYLTIFDIVSVVVFAYFLLSIYEKYTDETNNSKKIFFMEMIIAISYLFQIIAVVIANKKANEHDKEEKETMYEGYELLAVDIAIPSRVLTPPDIVKLPLEDQQLVIKNTGISIQYMNLSSVSITLVIAEAVALVCARYYEKLTEILRNERENNNEFFNDENNENAEVINLRDLPSTQRRAQPLPASVTRRQSMSQPVITERRTSNTPSTLPPSESSSNCSAGSFSLASTIDPSTLQTAAYDKENVIVPIRRSSIDENKP